MTMLLALHHPLIAGILIWTAVALAIACSLAMVAVGTAFQRLHYSAVVAAWAIPLVVVAVWIENPDWQARIKSALVALVVFWMNSVLTHATARAFRLRQAKHLQPQPGEGIEGPRRR